MRQNLFRKFGMTFFAAAFGLGLSSFSTDIFAQTAAPTPNTSAQKEETKKDKKDKNKKQPKTAETPAPTTNSKTLSPNENPAMIGKRNINGSTGNKFFGWLGGSKEKEAAIGKQMSMEVEQQAKMVDDPVITEYVNRVGQNIVLHSDAKTPFTIKVIQDDSVNAFALPGGYFYVNTGLILAADNEAELAGAMAHEIAHVTARHAMENQGKGAFINYAAIAGIIFGGPIISPILQNAGGLMGGLASLKFTRSAEEEADNLGVQYLYASGYDPMAMASMFEKLQSQNRKKPGTVAKLFSTHPQPENRRSKSLGLVSRFPENEEYVVSTSEFQRVKARLMRLSNAKASTSVDIDDNTPNGKPTLKRRTPDADNSTSPSTTDGSSTDGPPKLKRRDGVEQSTPTTTTPSTTTPAETSPTQNTTTTTAPAAPPKLVRRDSGTTPAPSPSPQN